MVHAYSVKVNFLHACPAQVQDVRFVTQIISMTHLQYKVIALIAEVLYLDALYVWTP